MAKVLIVYHSHGGNTRKMAEALAGSVSDAGCRVELKKVADARLEDLTSCQGLLLGTPCYFGNMSAEMKAFIDQSVKLFGKGELDGLPGGAFCSTGGIGGCGELALAGLTTAMLIHGMVVRGLRKGGHLGPLAIGEPDQRVLDECREYGERFAALVKRLAD